MTNQGSHLHCFQELSNEEIDHVLTLQAQAHAAAVAQQHQPPPQQLQHPQAQEQAEHGAPQQHAQHGAAVGVAHAHMGGEEGVEGEEEEEYDG